MARSKSSNDWLKEHFSDTYVKKAQQEGYRSRAAFKLLAIQEKYKIIKPNMTVLDIGAAPGGWAQLTAEWVGEKGKVIAVDLLPITSLGGVTIIQGDITDEAVWHQIKAAIAPKTQVDAIISDMAPNLSGITVSDQARSMGLVEFVVEIADEILAPQGVLLTKVFQGAGFDELLKMLRKRYKKVQPIKPPASRSRSRELYLLASGKP